MRRWIIALCIAAAVPFGLLVGSEFVDAQLTWRIPVKSGLTVGGLIHGKDRSNLSSLPAVATGQVLTSAGVATVPAWSASPTVTTWTLSGLTASKPVFTDGSKALVSTGTLGADQGGTGLATYAVGDIPYASAATTISKLAAVAAGSYLRSGGVTTASVWSTATLPNTVVAGDLLTATATNVVGVITDVAAGSVLRSGGVGVVPAYSTATYPGTAVAGDLLTATATNVWGVITDVAAGSLLRSGGVGVVPAYSTATFPGTAVAGDLLTATATNVWGVVTDVAAGSVLRSGGVGVVPAYSTLTIPDTVVAGDLLTATATNVVGPITGVGTGQVLVSSGVGVVPAYSASPSVTSLTLAGTLSGARQNVTVSATATVAVAATDSGRVYVGTAGSGTQIYTLPTLAAGLNFCFVAGDAGGDILIEPLVAAAIIGKGYTTGATDLGIMNTEASNAVGDSVCVTSDGTSWYGYMTIGTWANNVAS